MLQAIFYHLSEGSVRLVVMDHMDHVKKVLSLLKLIASDQDLGKVTTDPSGDMNPSKDSVKICPHLEQAVEHSLDQTNFLDLFANSEGRRTATGERFDSSVSIPRSNSEAVFGSRESARRLRVSQVSILRKA